MSAPAEVSPLLRIWHWSCITHTYLLHYNGEELLLGNQWFQFQDCLLKACTLQIKVSKRPVFRQILIFSCLIRWTPQRQTPKKISTPVSSFSQSLPLPVVLRKGFHRGSYTHHVTAVTRQGTQLWVKYELGRWKIHTGFSNKLWLEEDKSHRFEFLFILPPEKKIHPNPKQTKKKLDSSSLHPQKA